MEQVPTMKKTNFDLFLKEQLRDSQFAEQFRRAGRAWDGALELAALRERAGKLRSQSVRKPKTKHILHPGSE